MNELSTARLATLMTQRRKCLTQLRNLGVRQAELIADSQISALLELLEPKQQLIAALQKIEQALAPFHDQDPETRQWPSDDARRACAAEAQQCRQLLTEVMAAERTNEQQMTARRDQIARQLQQVADSARVRQAYHQQQAPAPQRRVAPGTPHVAASHAAVPHDLQGGRLDLTADH